MRLFAIERRSSLGKSCPSLSFSMESRIYLMRVRDFLSYSQTLLMSQLIRRFRDVFFRASRFREASNCCQAGRGSLVFSVILATFGLMLSLTVARKGGDGPDHTGISPAGRNCSQTGSDEPPADSRQRHNDYRPSDQR